LIKSAWAKGQKNEISRLQDDKLKVMKTTKLAFFPVPASSNMTRCGIRSTGLFSSCLVEPLKFAESQNHRMVVVGRDL